MDFIKKKLRSTGILGQTIQVIDRTDTIIEDISKEMLPERPWGSGNSPKSAVREFLKTHNEFIIDKNIEDKLQITAAPDGYLKRIT